MAAATPRTHRKSSSSKSKATSKASGSRNKRGKKPAPTSAKSSLRREIYGVVVAAITLLLFLALVSHAPARGDQNWIGQVGHFVAEGVFFLFGIGAFALVALSSAIAGWLLTGKGRAMSPGRIIGAALLMLAVVIGSSVLAPSAHAWNVPLGGWLGTAAAGSIVGVLGRAGAVLVLLAAAIIGGILATRSSVVDVTARAVDGVRNTGGRLRFLGAIAGVFSSMGAVITGIFQRRPAKQAPALVDSEFEDDVWQPKPMAGDEEAPKADVPEPATPNNAHPPQPIPPHAPSKAREVEVAASSQNHLPPETAEEQIPGVQEPPARQSRPPIRPAARPRASHPPVDEKVGVAARARRALEAFRQGGAPPVDGAAPSPDPAAYPASVRRDEGPAAVDPPAAFSAADDAPLFDRASIDAQLRHAIHNPMVDTTRQNAAVDLDAPSSIFPRPAPSTVPPPAPVAPPTPRDDEESAIDAQEDITRPVEAFASQPRPESVEEPVKEPVREPLHDVATPARPSTGPQIIESAAKKERMTSDTMDRALREMAAQRDETSWAFPSLDMLSYEEPTAEIDEEGLQAMATQLVEALADYKVKGKVTGICPGPVVTRFEFEPEPGTKLRKISGLSTDIAMRLRAENVRIIAPIPGKGCVGVEIPNDIRETVFLKEILADHRFTDAKSKISLALGKDIEGFPVVANLAKMPHLLVAGTTGSGKSVSINSMIMSVLFNASPDEVRMILIDPKQLEFALYEDIPHLLLPVVTDPNQAATALQWAVDEMERRYRLMKELKVRNLEGYNDKLAHLEREIERERRGGKPASRFAEEALTEVDMDGRPHHRHMPYLIVVVDEFADLMMAAGKDVEIAVARIAQKARAAGIHCILATQRPSVDVLTGTIKSNFPTRMSFRLISGTDSRTVIDTQGAENLLGMGDMLYRPPGTSDLVRVHGAFVDEDEIENVVEFLKDQREAEYDEEILSAAIEGTGEESEDVDPKFDEAIDVVLDAGYASISMVQRKLSVGYNRAANIVEEMERRGIVGPSGGGASRREVLISHPGG